MAKKRLPKGPKTLYDKVKDADPNFVQEVYQMSDDQLHNKLGEIAKSTTNWENLQAEDKDIKSLKEQLKSANETYSSQLGPLKLKRKLIFKILQERGKAP